MVSVGRADFRGVGGALNEGIGRTFVIFNPASGRGRGASRIGQYLELLDQHIPGHTHAATTAAGDEYLLAERAIEDGYDVVVAVGGDGTWSHVANTLVRAKREGRTTPAFGVLPSGTGNDFGRNLGLEFRDMENAVRELARGGRRTIDVGRVITPVREDRTPDSPSTDRYFLNVVGFGFDVAVIDAAAGARFLRGEPLYKITALQQLFRFPGVNVQAKDLGGRSQNGPHLMVTISNGRFFGGGFPIAPGATIDDGLLHGCFIADAPALTRARLFGLAEKGRHVTSDRVTMWESTSVTLTFGAPPRFEMDGDVFVSSSEHVEIEILPGALTLVGA